MKRSENGINIRRFLEGYGVKVHLYRESTTQRPANVVYGGRSWLARDAGGSTVSDYLRATPVR